jgi:hypothetical protein
MQRGFTENTSSINTGLLLTEFKNESKEKKTPVFAVSLDGQRAFDEVWKQALMRKMYFYKHSVPILGHFESIIPKCYNPC